MKCLSAVFLATCAGDSAAWWGASYQLRCSGQAALLLGPLSLTTLRAGRNPGKSCLLCGLARCAGDSAFPSTGTHKQGHLAQAIAASRPAHECQSSQ